METYYKSVSSFKGETMPKFTVQVSSYRYRLQECVQANYSPNVMHCTDYCSRLTHTTKHLSTVKGGNYAQISVTSDIIWNVAGRGRGRDGSKCGKGHTVDGL